MLIAEALYAVGLVFWYERRLEIVVCDDGKYYTEIIFPDFTIMLPDGTLIYWEHFGMMENPKYQEDNYRRLQKYLSNGIYPPKNLIMTPAILTAYSPADTTTSVFGASEMILLRSSSLPLRNLAMPPASLPSASVLNQ